MHRNQIIENQKRVLLLSSERYKPEFLEQGICNSGQLTVEIFHSL